MYKMNKAFLVEVDDSFPLDIFNQVLVFANESTGCLLWPMIITKALLKFHQEELQNVKGQDTGVENNNFLSVEFIYSLTGFISVQIPILNDSDSISAFEQIKEILNKNDTKAIPRVFAYTDKEYIPEVEIRIENNNGVNPACPPNAQLDTSDIKSDQQKHDNSYKIAIDRYLNYEKDLKKIFRPYVGYSIFEHFNNRNFNLGYVRDFTNEEYTLKKKYE